MTQASSHFPSSLIGEGRMEALMRARGETPRADVRVDNSRREAHTARKRDLERLKRYIERHQRSH